jgi:hypothetical protein
MKFTNELVKRAPVILSLDTDPERPVQGATDDAVSPASIPSLPMARS